MKEQAGTRSAGLSGRTGKFSVLAVLLLMAVAWGAAPAVSTAAVNAVLTPSRTTGVAPLCVFVDATSSTASGITRPMHELLFEWDFGDTGSGTWATDGESRNTAHGPVAAHVFETAGTYTVSLIASDGAGGVDSKTAQIVVSNPDTVFSGTNTICFSQTSDFTGAPSGSQHVTVSNNLTDLQSYVAAGKRLLLHRGQSWNAPSSLGLHVSGPGTLGAFGTGAQPYLLHTVSGNDIVTMGSGTTQLTDWRIMDLKFDGSTYSDASLNSAGRVSQILVLRCTFNNNYRMVQMEDSITDWYGLPLDAELAVVDTTQANTLGYCTYISGRQIAILGNSISNSPVTHLLRMPTVDRGVIGHNNFSLAGPDRHALKLHAHAWDAAGAAYHQYTWKVVISDNSFAGDSPWNTSIGPQDAGNDERVRDVIVERNYYTGGSTVQFGIELSAQEVTVRNNIFNCTNQSYPGGVLIQQRGIEPAPLNNRFFNNTAYCGTHVVTFLAIDSTAGNTTVRNNLITNPATYGTPVVNDGTGSGLVSDHNLATTTPGFVSGSPSVPADFALASGSAAISYGTTVPVWDDYTGADRPVGTPDAGAYEYGTGTYQAPVAVNDSYSTYKNTALNQSAPGVLANDTVSPGYSLTASLVTGVSHGSLTLNSNGSFTYTPSTGYAGSDSFVYKAYDSVNYSNNATVTLTITNRAPVAVNDSYSTPMNTALNQSAPGVLANDTDADSDPLTASLVTSVSHGSLTLNSNGSFLYTPTTGYTGSDSFVYRAYDGTAYSSNATVSLTVTSTNHPPVAVNDSYSTNEDTVLNQAAPGVLSNDTDADSDPLTASLVTGVSHGSLTLNSNGSFTYTPSANYNGSDSFVYRAYDGQAYSGNATVSLTITAVNDAPVAVNDSYSTPMNTALNQSAPGVLANDTDVDGDTLTASLVTSVSHGSLTLNSNGSFLYTPTTGYTGSDSFVYRAYDGAAYSGNATVSLTVTGGVTQMYVDPSYNSGTTGWGVDHFATVQSAITAAASSGVTITVNPGTYTEHITFSGKNIVVTSTNPDSSSVVATTILNGSSTGTVVSFTNSETSAATLKGFTIQNGSPSGIVCNPGSPTISQNVVQNNTTTTNGGGILVSSGTPTIVRNTIKSNTATAQNGGGIYTAGSATIKDNQITGNTCYWNGGGIFLSACSPTIVGNTISNNTVTYSTCVGGGIQVYGSGASPAITNCVLWGNTSPSGGQQINLSSNVTATVSYCDVSGGQAGVPVGSGSTLNWGSGNLNSTPAFVSTSDFHLQYTSPCIDAANGTVASTVDRDGNGRVDFSGTANTGTGTPAYVDMGCYELQSATVTYISVGSQDGWVLESASGSGTGGSNNSTDSSTSALRAGDDTSKKQYKSVVSFDTSALPDSATILSAQLNLMRGTLAGSVSNLGTLYADIQGTTGFNGSTTLENADFQATASATQVATMTIPSSNGTWSSGSLNSTGLSYVNKTGTTQLRVYFSTGHDTDTTADYLGFYSGEYTTTGNRPQLVVTYH